jgi:carbamoyltransferase
MTNIWGISANSHDAAVSVWHDKQLVFAAHSERYSGRKNDGDLHVDLIEEARLYGRPDMIIWYENPDLKTDRQWHAGQGDRQAENNVVEYLKRYGLGDRPLYIGSHHASHAAAGYYTSAFNDATVVVIDSIGEYETLTVWQGQGNDLTKVYTQSYPDSVGLWFSSMTQRIGLKPNEEEYILMGMAAYGNPDLHKCAIYEDFFESVNGPEIRFKHNLHKGCLDWRLDLLSEQDCFDIAAATQAVYEELLQGISAWARGHLPSGNLILMGGCALNCVANSKITESWDNIWIMPNPGDAGSSVGAVCDYFKQKIHWPGAYLGTDMGGEYPVDALIEELVTNKIVGVASGRAEFGPRALGHRSLLADPRGPDIKDTVNKIKRRQEFRPFAPAILEEHVHDYFTMPAGITASPYMQFVGVCRLPDQFPAIVHKDGTSRVQTVGKADSPGFRQLLERWYALTGCPMLLNTSLNIKGEPMVNDRATADRFEQLYGVKVVT